jgi:AP endonuclease-2
LIHEDKREVVLVGDLNACAAVIDHVEGELMVAKALLQEKELVGEGLEGDGAGAGAGEEGDLFFAGESRKGRRWLRDLLIPDGDDAQSDEKMRRRRKGEAEMIDITRKFWPGRKGMYTCKSRLPSFLPLPYFSSSLSLYFPLPLPTSTDRLTER